mmetsp:Transcript_511/g.1029  ORF Transcript_511/g.1029 Transcript_511/m.1029 type:complete len:285 (-) Transcript_511:269-1123(-)|eukprot:CAMPEP_0172314802 /NCGR_PEP_ID=MMETSP1058-20130122/23344_1 /TAXON_ID=83371 /ORGANISM="Detonula confervacea, Strain CCMP 353" /LENGTH=284 /DNA_ID=CAMNT_0013028749 /DNA_START=28 /DNA_END=882 /DNA_ORIENTATION=-
METLVETTHLVVKQKFEPLEAMANAAANAIDMDALGNLGEVANKYDVYDAGNGGDKFRVVEKSDYCGLTGRCCCNPNHELQLHVYAPEVSHSEEVFIYDRPCKCGSCCACCSICQQEMIASDNTGGQFGYIKQPFLGGGMSPKLQVMEREGEEEYATIESNAFCCIAGICCDNTFTVKDRDGNEIGKIVKKKPSDLAELATEIVSDADVFAIEFNKELEPEKKATLFGALYLIDYMFFENEGQGNVDLVNQQCSFKCCDLYCCGCVCPCNCNCGGNSDANNDGE